MPRPFFLSIATPIQDFSDNQRIFLLLDHSKPSPSGGLLHHPRTLQVRLVPHVSNIQQRLCFHYLFRIAAEGGSYSPKAGLI